MYYFAYGPSLNKKVLAQHCPTAKPKFSATLPNYKLIFTGWSRQWQGGIASIKPFKGEKVEGGVYEIPESDVRLLDRYENSPSVYTRFKVMVWTDGGDAVEAFTYIMAAQAQETLPSKEYLTGIRQGFRDWGIE